jgi:hypothetical protein
MFSQAEINLMEKQLLFLLDYDLGINEAEIVLHFQPFLDQYSFESPVMASSSTIATPPTPVTPVRQVAGAAASGARRQRVASRGQNTYVAPPLDRSGSSSSLESEDSMPRTPESNLSSPPTPPRTGTASGGNKVQGRSVSYQVSHNPSDSIDYTDPAFIPLQSQLNGKPTPLNAMSSSATVSNGFLGRFLRSADKRKKSRIEEEEEQAVAALSWNAV